MRSVFRDFDLHSSMDRLKEKSAELFLQHIQHLHSSMDRLKAADLPEATDNESIYIPVWID